MKLSFLTLGALLALTSPLAAADWAVVEQTSAFAGIQTIQAADYYGNYQVTGDLTWTLGLDWNHQVALRGGLLARAIATSPVWNATVYPGSQGWGWIAAADLSPWSTEWKGLTASPVLTAFWSQQAMELTGLYRSYDLQVVGGSLGCDFRLPGFQGLSVRLQMPLALDLRPDFWLSWRSGIEASVVVRGVGGTIP